MTVETVGARFVSPFQCIEVQETGILPEELGVSPRKIVGAILVIAQTRSTVVRQGEYKIRPYKIWNSGQIES